MTIHKLTVKQQKTIDSYINAGHKNVYSNDLLKVTILIKANISYQYFITTLIDGKSKPYYNTHYIGYKSDVEAFINKVIAARQHDYDKKQSRKNDMINKYQVNDILVTCWGYDQTNRDFYKIIKRDNNKVILCQLRENIAYDINTMTGIKMPIIDDSNEGNIVQGKVTEYGVKINDYINAMPWNGKAANFSDYA